MSNEQPIIRAAKPGEEAAIHNAHMRSIREVCVKDHGEDEIKGWGNRELGDRWVKSILEDFVLVIELKGEISGVGMLRVIDPKGDCHCHLHALYLTPEVTGFGLAKVIMNRFIEKAKSVKAKRIELSSSITGLNFYKKFGFKESGGMERIEIGGHPVTSYPMVFHLD